MMLAAGALVVAGLVVWALTRTVEPAQPTSVFDNVATDSVATGPANSPVPDTSGTPAASATAPNTATSATPPPVQGDRNAVARISVEDLREKVKAGTVSIIDVRDSAAYQQGHIPGSINLPFASLEGQLEMIPRGKEIVTYCT